jgi:ribulose-phosphate 3-epimerase
MGEEARSALDAGADLLHFDVMDGHFVGNLTMGPNMCRSIRGVLPEAFFDVHLMVTEPGRFLEPFADAGADHLTFHHEAVADPIDLAAAIHAAGMTVGLAINPPTGVSDVLPLLEHVDLVLVMSVHPGFAGQSFIPEVLEKARAIKTRLGPRQRLAVDGGVNARTAPACLEAGCDVLAAASAIFAADDYAEAISALRGGARLATRSGEN